MPQNQWGKMTGKIMGNELRTWRKWVKIGILDRHRVDSDSVI